MRKAEASPVGGRGKRVGLDAGLISSSTLDFIG